MKTCTAHIKHSEETIKAMARAQYESFRPKSYYIMMVSALLLLALALFIPSIGQGFKTLMIMLGCFGIVGLGSPPRQLAKQVIHNLKGRFPNMGYTFTEKSVQLTGADVSVLEYKEIIHLSEDNRYLYIFIKNRSAFMLERSSAKPDVQELKQLVAEKTGLVWTRPGAMAKLSSLRYERVKTRL